MSAIYSMKRNAFQTILMVWMKHPFCQSCVYGFNKFDITAMDHNICHLWGNVFPHGDTLAPAPPPNVCVILPLSILKRDLLQPLDV